MAAETLEAQAVRLAIDDDDPADALAALAVVDVELARLRADIERLRDDHARLKKAAHGVVNAPYPTGAHAAGAEPEIAHLRGVLAALADAAEGATE